ncbi:L-lactate permease [Anaeromyxobacter paludicola]|uniref:L-lactate permease n=1 Tax=Anaeromyxobacter paludicola TaxID=2918171 RepID=A0ABM7X8T3_9BACT|nr:L-lactate permease [Anaeromyxobacter paludicola]BDG08232.1 lactate permease [Anaeromyxobacter paludicola]
MLPALVAALPLFVLLVGLPLLMKPAVKVAPVAWAVTVLIAILYFHLPPGVTLLAALQGALFGIFPIMYIPFGALVVYNTLKATGWMDKMQGAMASLTIDRRAQALLIGFGFGAFLEGICGFGAPVAIPASILVGLGYEPMMAALVCLVANTGPVPFGSLAIPTVTLAGTTQLDLMRLSRMSGRLMAPLAFIMAFATVFAMSRGKGVKGALPVILVTGLSFSVTQLLVSNFVSAELTDVVASLVCLSATALYLSRRRDARPWLFPGEGAAVAKPKEFHPRELFLSWLPYLLLAVLVIAVNLEGTKRYFNGSAKGWEWMLVQFQIYNPGKLYKFTWLQSPGTIMLIAGLLAFPFLGIRLRTFGEQFGKTARQMVPSFVAVASILSISEVMNLALPILDPKTKLAVWGTLGVKQISMVNTMANSIVSVVSAHVYPLLSPVFGTIGVFLTGSNTSSNALFGNLQKLTAHGLGLSDVLMASGGNAGSPAGKMISPQSIVIAAAAVGLLNQEGRIMRQTIKYTIPYLVILGLMVWGYAFLFPHLVP